MRKIILICVAALLCLFVYKKITGNGAMDVNGFQGTIQSVKGNTITLTSGHSVRLLGVKDGHTEVEMFVQNSYLGKQVTLYTDTKLPQKFGTSTDTVCAYAVLPSGWSLNHLIVKEYPELYSQILMTDSIGWVKDGMTNKKADLALYMKQRSFLIIVDNGTGTTIGMGFFINESGLAVTNNHVLPPDSERAAKIVLYPNDPHDNNIDQSKFLNVNNLYWSEGTDGMDITIFSVALDGREQVPYFNLSKKQATQGSKAAIYGNPEGLTASYAEGQIGAYRTFQNKMRPVSYAQLDLNVNHGNSGGPVCDEYGNVIAVVDWGLENTQGLNFGIDILQVRNVLDQKGLHYGGQH